MNFTPRALLASGGARLDGAIPVQWELTPMTADGPLPRAILTERGVFRAYVEPGPYLMAVRLGEVVVERQITIPAAGVFAPDVVLNATRVILRPRIAAEAPVKAKASLRFTQPTGLDVTLAGAVDTYLPAGETTVTATLDAARVPITLTLIPGVVLDRNIIISAAVLAPEVLYVEGMPVTADELFVEIFAARRSVDGSRVSIVSGTGPDQEFHLSAGDYVAVASMGAASAESPFSVALVQRIGLPIVLNAGVLAASSPGAERLEIVTPPDIGGNRASVAVAATDSTVETLPAGDYVLVARRGNQMAETAFTITPGERTELTLPLP